MIEAVVDDETASVPRVRVHPTRRTDYVGGKEMSAPMQIVSLHDVRVTKLLILGGHVRSRIKEVGGVARAGSERRWVGDRKHVPARPERAGGDGLERVRDEPIIGRRARVCIAYHQLVPGRDPIE